KLFFFLQAEDGIRDFHVTGVQTCALPISHFKSGFYIGLIKVFPCFDQPDIKATFKMRVTAPAEWLVITSNLESTRQVSEQKTLRSEERRVGKKTRVREK